MISDKAELRATLEYLAKLADTLEGMRCYGAEAVENTALLPLTMAGPLAHIRENLAAVRAYIATDTTTGSESVITFGISRRSPLAIAATGKETT